LARPRTLAPCVTLGLAVLWIFGSDSAAYADETSAPTVAPVPVAEAPDACSVARTSATTLMESGKLSDARKKLLYCAQSTCRDHETCRQSLDQVTVRLAHVRLEATDGEGRALSRVTVTVDGKTVSDGMGADLAVDPGTHAFEVRHESGAVQRRDVTLTEGERGRRERFVLDAEESAPGEGRRVAGKVVTVGAGAALVAAVVLTVIASGTDTRCTQVPIVTGFQSVCSELPRSFAPAAIAYATAATAGVVGIALWATAPSKEGLSVGMGPWGVSGRF
jgi:hypothetical protein